MYKTKNGVILIGCNPIGGLVSKLYFSKDLTVGDVVVIDDQKEKPSLSYPHQITFKIPAEDIIKKYDNNGE